MNKKMVDEYRDKLRDDVSEIKTDIKWMKEKFEQNEKHFQQVYRNKDELTRIKTVGSVFGVIISLALGFFGIRK